MKKQKKAILIGAALLIIVIIAIAAIFWRNNSILSISQNPFNDLNAADILSISVFAVPPNEIVLVDDMEQIEEIVCILKTVIVYQKSNEWKDSNGQMVTFTINKATGEVVEVSAYNPHLIINGQGYKTKYQPCENLNRIANTILNTRFSGQSSISD